MLKNSKEASKNIVKEKHNSKSKTQKITFAALLAAIYAALTLALSFLSYGPVQFRIAEGLTVLPYFSPYAIYGLFIGCIASNIISPMGIPDLIFGSIATLIAAILTYYIGRSNLKYKKVLAPLPSVLINAIIIGTMLKILYVKDMPLYLNMIYVGVGQLVCCYGLGLPLMSIIEKNKSLNKILK
ncbi:QueT transporter family protein [Hathewaya histolytica]|uniref:Substrate-specific component QueT (COG4708) of predicted queuosine-regulated ECF transporter n=1 Tax=Hathewaya histolytica TaxID=1498 RepID=A0A4V6KE44_HATHI|nr:QueT transporter family protein [Hathewaya histolytica]VTQ93257.1 substrate-specific component QueT (COG4708) of predicted queuosine-regulated ECF transporter [Hathewaya histolytica]